MRNLAVRQDDPPSVQPVSLAPVVRDPGTVRDCLAAMACREPDARQPGTVAERWGQASPVWFAPVAGQPGPAHGQRWARAPDERSSAEQADGLPLPLVVSLAPTAHAQPPRWVLRHSGQWLTSPLSVLQCPVSLAVAGR